MINNSVQRIFDALSKVTNVFTRIPDNGGLQLSVGGGVGMAYHSAYPMSILAVAETDTEVTELQASTTRFVDARTTELWTTDGSGWSTETYGGDRSFLRPKTLCFSPPNGRVYYCDGFLRLTQVSLTADPTVN